MDERDYKHTLNLPKTDFPMKADLPKREPERLRRWLEEDLYGRVQAARRSEGAPRFILHDGPPYANGKIHIGHAMNKILKDIVVRSKSLEGYETPYVPGWDCHGLPIELQVDKELGPKKKSMSDVEIRRACRAFADRWIEEQRVDFKRLGILGAWDTPYRTMDFAYQAEIAKAFGEFAGKGLVTFGFKAVLWCVHCKTALAEAEVEYEDRVDPSIYVGMPIPLEDEGLKRVWGDDLPGDATAFYATIWTTTPWTLPANRAIAVGPDIEYVWAHREGELKIYYLVAEKLVGQVDRELEFNDFWVKGASRRTGQQIVDGKLAYRRPFDQDGKSFGFLAGEHVSTTDGTGLVHTAPGHGRDDYEVVRRSGFTVDDPALCPVDAAGYFDANAPEALQRKRVVGAKIAEQDANTAVLAALEAGDPSGAKLLHTATASHSYPHCWRCKKPVIFRATHQWFIDLAALRDKALSEIREKVQWVPAFGANRIGAMVENRLEWTISRQRRWGSPITFLKCVPCGEKGLIQHYPPLDDASSRDRFFANLVAIFRANGADAWYDDVDFPASSFLPAGSKCPACQGEVFDKVRDILDVWFDSGVSHAAVLRSGAYGVADPYSDGSNTAVLYLEGHDQHRGWFQSSLLTSVALAGSAPYSTVVTHGFTMDGQGKKMSKSDFNGVAPQEMIAQHGADVLRLFFASSDYTDDVRMNQEIVTRSTDAYRKIRNTAKFLLSLLADTRTDSTFDPVTNAVADDELDPIDRYILSRGARLVADCRAAYGRYEIHGVTRRLLEFCTVDLSALWCDVKKDALYVLAVNDPTRRSAQTAAFRLTEALALVLQPICPFTSEEIWQSLPGRAASAPALATFDDVKLTQLPGKALEAWERLLGLRADVQKKLEPLRRDGVVGSSAQALVEVGFDEEGEEDLDACALTLEGLAELFIVPEVIRSDEEGFLDVRAAEGAKCPRCWQVRRDVDDAGLCPRCRKVVAS